MTSSCVFKASRGLKAPPQDDAPARLDRHSVQFAGEWEYVPYSHPAYAAARAISSTAVARTPTRHRSTGSVAAFNSDPVEKQLHRHGWESLTVSLSHWASMLRNRSQDVTKGGFTLGASHNAAGPVETLGLVVAAGLRLAGHLACLGLAGVGGLAGRSNRDGEGEGQGTLAAATRGLCFARIADRQRGYVPPPSLKKVEYYSVRKVRPDGRCMFRALVQGMATNKGMSLGDDEETAEADELRLAVADSICHSEKRRATYEEALIAITLEESLKRYCQRIIRSDFWGGESELLVLSRMCSQPIIVYIPESMASRDGARWGSGYVPIAEYGSEYHKATKGRKARKPVRLLYNGVNHYDLLL